MDESEKKSILKKAKETWKNGFLSNSKEMVKSIINSNPVDKWAKKLLEKINRQEKDDYLRELKKEMKDILRVNKLDKALSIIEELERSKKYESITKKARIILKRKQINLLVSEMKRLISIKNWEEAKDKANQLMALKWNHKMALLGLKKIARQLKKDWKSLIEVEKPENHSEIKTFSLQFALLVFSFMFISSTVFFALTIDEDNLILGSIGIGNIAKPLKDWSSKQDSKRKDYQDLQQKADEYSVLKSDKDYQIVNSIIDNRLVWSQLTKKINDITHVVYKNNDLNQNIIYSSYKYNVATGQLELKGILSDPEGKNLTKIAELEEAFKYFPGTKENPVERPYFYEVDNLRSFKKKLDKQTDEFKSSFHIKMLTNSPKQIQS